MGYKFTRHLHWGEYPINLQWGKYPSTAVGGESKQLAVGGVSRQPAVGELSKQRAVGKVSMRFEEGDASETPAVGRVSKTITEGGDSETPAEGGASMRSAVGGDSKKPAIREKLHITGACAALMACLAILWISGDAGTEETKHGVPQEPWWGSTLGMFAKGISTLNYGMGNDIPTARVEDMMPDFLRLRFRDWDQGEMGTVSEMYLHEDMHRVYMAKKVVWEYVITGIVMDCVTKLQCYERAMMGDISLGSGCCTWTTWWCGTLDSGHTGISLPRLSRL